MKYILFILFFPVTAFSQWEWNIRLDPAKEIDSIHVMTSETSGSFAGRGTFTQMADFIAMLDNYLALASHTHTFASLTSKPTTVSGYGITDAITTSKIITDVITSNHSVSSTTGTEVDLGATLETGYYAFIYYVLVNSSTAAMPKLGINYTGSQTMYYKIRWTGTSTTAAANEIASTTTSGADMNIEESAYYPNQESTTTPVRTIPLEGGSASLVIIEGVIRVITAGDLELWHSSTSAAATLVEAGSSLIVTKLN